MTAPRLPLLKSYSLRMVLGVRILDGDGLRVAQRLLRVCEAHLVLAQIGSRLCGIKFDVHELTMHIPCIEVKAATQFRIGALAGSRLTFG